MKQKLSLSAYQLKFLDAPSPTGEGKCENHKRMTAQKKEN